MGQRGFSLEEVGERYPVILVDTSALIRPMNIDGRPPERISPYYTELDSAGLFIDYTRRGLGIHITDSIIKEYLRVSSDRSNKILVDLLESNGGVIRFTGGERLWYDFWHNIWDEQFSRVRRKFEIGEVDYDFLISGVVLSESRKKPTALVSNDTKMIRPWKFLLKKSGLTPAELGFFTRNYHDIFKKLKLPKGMRTS